MTAPSPIPGPNPQLFSLAYQKKQFSTGGVFTPIVSDAVDCLAHPASDATTAETWSQTHTNAVANGTYVYNQVGIT